VAKSVVRTPPANRRPRVRSAAGAAIVAMLVAGCGSGNASAPSAAPGSAGPTGSAVAAPPTATREAPPTAGPTVLPAPTYLLPTTTVPAGFRATDTVPFRVDVVVDGLLIGANADSHEVIRWRASTLEAIGKVAVGKPGAFAPDLQGVAPGTGGLWVTLASEHAVGLLDLKTGKVLRKVKILGNPYDVVEHDGVLWIADFGWSEVTRYDLATDAIAAEIPVGNPTDVIAGEGSIWAPIHIGRAAEHEPIDPGGQVFRIDPATNAVVARVDVGPRPYYLTAGFGSIWTGSATGGSVSRIDAATNEPTTIWIAEDGAFDIEVLGDSVWAVVGPQWPRERVCDPATSFFVRIDPATNTLRERIAYPCPIAITPDGDSFWVAGDGADGMVSTRFEPAG
jgi:streptogramin lyase